MTFKELNIIPPLIKALDRLNFSHATKIQSQVIPLACEGNDILGIAQTGSGKTLSFSLPILQGLYNLRTELGIHEGKFKRRIQALIIAPTRELAIQIGDSMKPFCTNTNLKHAVVYGGVSQFHQIKTLQKGIDVLIATPGRLMDLMKQGYIDFSSIKYFVLDEADKMLNMGFIDDICFVIRKLPTKRQNLFFSATMPEEISQLASDILFDPVSIKVAPTSSTVNTVVQQVYHLEEGFKRQLLIYLVKNTLGYGIIVFVKTKDATEKVIEYLKSENILCDHIHRNRSQNARQRALKSLKDGSIKVLVATDIAARGIDINDLSCVINYDLPSDPETYVHRIGRTARAGKDGLAISFCIEAEKDKLLAIEKLIGKSLEIINNQSYKQQTISNAQFLGTFNFDAGTKIGNNKKKRYYSKKRNK